MCWLNIDIKEKCQRKKSKIHSYHYEIAIADDIRYYPAYPKHFQSTNHSVLESSQKICASDSRDV